MTKREELEEVERVAEAIWVQRVGSNKDATVAQLQNEDLAQAFTLAEAFVEERERRRREKQRLGGGGHRKVVHG